MQGKTLIGNNFGRIEDRAVIRAYNRRFRPWWIQWCDRHLCHVTIEPKILINTTIFRKKTRNSLFPPCKTSIGNNYRPLRIEWCDRHLCHVTGSDHAHRFNVKQDFERM